MNEFWLSIDSHLAVVLFIGVLIAERAFPIPVHLHPFWFLRKTAQNIAQRVHPSITRPRSQQRISGLMAALLMLLLWVAVPALLCWLAELKLWLSAVILWLCLFSQPWLHEAKLIQHSVQRGQQKLAQARLQRWVNRDCDSLSVLGIEKTASEQCVKRQLQAWFGVVFWFVVLGPIAALLYRVCFELSRAWPAQLAYWRDFGAVSQVLFTLINWPPYVVTLAVINAIQLLHAVKTGLATRPLRFPYFSQQEQQLFFSIAQTFPLELGGPVKHQGIKQARLRFKHPAANNENRLEHAIKYFTLIQIVLFIIALLTLFGLNI